MKRLLLLGGGHAHLQVLQAWARQRPAGAELLLVTPYPALLYSGMVPGLVAGHYRPAQCRVALAAAAGVQWLQGAAVALDAGARSVQLADGRCVGYDWLSLDTGAVQRRDRLPGAAEHALFVRPIEAFVDAQPRLLERAAQQVLDVVVLGGGAAGFELALALQHRLQHTLQGARVSLVTGGPEPLEGYPAAARRAGAQVLARRGVTVWREQAVAVQAGSVQLASGMQLACDTAIVATGSEPPAWLAGSGLALCPRGFVATGATLQSLSHAEVFAAGDVATRVDRPHPRSGVYAVRAGPPLALNLRAALSGQPLRPYQPPARTLNLLSCGERRAITAWGGLALGERGWGRLAWWCKDHIDRAFVARFGGAAAAASLARAEGDQQA